LDTINTTSFEVNVSINETNLANVTFDWNNTNYSYYDDSLVLMMNFDNVSALGENDTYVVDLSKYKNNGTVYGATWNSSGKYGGAFEFDGVDDWINISEDNSLKINKTTTIVAWIYPRAYGNDGWGKAIYHYFKNLGLDYDGLSFAISNVSGYDKKIWFGLGNGTSWNNAYGTTNISLNTWSYVAGTYNGSIIKVYVDGVEEGSANLSSSILYESGISPRIGSVTTGDSNRFFNGSIDEVRIWNRSLSADEVYQQYISNLNKYDTDKWLLYINQSKNATDGLDDGNYTYPLGL
jgi:hypothetical protein